MTPVEDTPAFRLWLRDVVDAWFDASSDASDAGYSVVARDALPALVDQLARARHTIGGYVK